MRITIVAVGKIKQAGLRAEIDDYLGRVRRYATCTEVELKDAPAKELLPRIERAVPERATLVALEVDGKRFDSQGFARFLLEVEQQSGAVAFLIGGAYGLPPEVSARASVKLSLSPMTLPHRLARLFLCEQLYRAFTIQRNEPYSH